VTVVAIGSVRGAPGVTTAALLLASCLERAVLVEADPSGGVLAVRYGLGREPGLTTLAATPARERARLLDHAQDAGGVPVVVGPDAADASHALWRGAGDALATSIEHAGGWVVVDAGRVHRPTPFVRRADLVLVAVRPFAEQLVGAVHAVSLLRRTVDGDVAVVLVGDGPYRVTDVELTLGSPVLGPLPDDPATAEHLRDGRGTRAQVARSRLARAVAALAEDVGVLADDLARRPAEVTP
jgi:MinD-like ATPase involved in chromosome partitioning or flagellar assembly